MNDRKHCVKQKHGVRMFSLPTYTLGAREYSQH